VVIETAGDFASDVLLSSFEAGVKRRKKAKRCKKNGN
jgi:hypothetical protein